ncbi:MAG: hypothetical protein J5842_04180 [Lachnospiraceae bacterium]|nr:hypothetical protein [Lachnospiraceae bacterium]
MLNANDYLYKDNTEYELDQMREKIKFEQYRLGAQLDSVNKRLSLLLDEFKVNLYLELAILIVYAVCIGVFMFSFSPIARVVVSIPYVLSTAALFLGTPVIVFKALRALVLYRLNMYSDRYADFMEKNDIKTYESERRSLVRVLSRYAAYMEKIEEWETMHKNGELPFSEEQLKDELEKMDLSEEVPVTSPFGGRLKIITQGMTALCCALPFIVAIVVIVKMAG